MVFCRVLVTLVLGLAACGESEDSRSQPTRTTWDVRGVVRDVAPSGRQIRIEHEEIPGLMPAMTMNFDVPDIAYVQHLQAGDEVEFTVEYELQGLRIVRIAALGAGLVEAATQAGGFAGLVEVGALAPGFSLIDHAGEPFALHELRGKVVLVDFIFTNCSGPCPLQTASHVALQRKLAPAERAGTHFVSVTIDPARDNPEALRSYAERLGVELASWSFVTGSEREVAEVSSAYGIGHGASQDGGTDHMLVSYLIDPVGRVAQRYLGSSVGSDAMALDVAAVLAKPPSD